MHLFAGMYAVVSRQVTLLCKTFITDGAGVGSFPGVSPAVNPQQALVLKALPALRARVLRPPGIPRSAVRRAVGIPGVLRLVALQPAGRHEALAADRALMRLLGVVRPLVNDQTSSL